MNPFKEVLTKYKAMVDATVYIMFLKGLRDQPNNKFIGVTIEDLNKKLRQHKKQSTRVRDDFRSKLHKAMQKKGIDNWAIMPLAELWLTTRKDFEELQDYYIELLKPDLN